MDKLVIAPDKEGIQNLYETGSDKLKRITDDSILPKYIRHLVQYFQQTIPGSSYNVEDEFNSYKNKIKPKFSLFHSNIRSLNCHHKEFMVIRSRNVRKLLTELYRHNVDQVFFHCKHCCSSCVLIFRKSVVKLVSLFLKYKCLF